MDTKIATPSAQVSSKLDFQFSKLIHSGVVDFGKQSADYSTHRPGFPPRFFNKLTDVVTQASGSSGFDWKKMNVLDLGTGPGTVAFEIAKFGAKVHGIDISKGQIDEADKKAKELKLDNLATFSIGTAEETKQETASFDVVLAGQCWWWFKHELAMPEIRRVLKPGGILCIGAFCYLPNSSPVAADTEAMILKMNPKWTMYGCDGMYPGQVDQVVVQGGFDMIEQFSFDHKQLFTHEGWRGRMRTCNGVGSSGLGAEKVAQFDKDLAALLKAKYPQEPLTVMHRIWALIARSPGPVDPKDLDKDGKLKLAPVGKWEFTQSAVSRSAI